MCNVMSILACFRPLKSTTFSASVCDGGDKVESREWRGRWSGFAVDGAVQDEDFAADCGIGNSVAYATKNQAGDDGGEEGADGIDDGT